MDLNKFYECFYSVVNLSNYTLDIKDLQVLGKGLKFCPTPANVDHGNLKESIDKFFRWCALRLFFTTHEEINEDSLNEHDTPLPFSHKELRLPSKFTPTMPSNLEHIYYLIVDEVLSYKTRKTHRNLSGEQLNRLYILSDLENVIFKKANKGSNIVLWDKEKYFQEVKRQLCNAKYYLKLDGDISPKIKCQVDALITSMLENNEISQQCAKYLLEGDTCTSIFYMLPKIHKNKSNPPGRPIVSSVGCPTERISQFVDILLRPYAQRGKSFIRDTPDFIQKVYNIILSENDWLVIMDVSNLYTNIPHHEGIEKVNNILQDRVNLLPSNTNIIKMLSLVLKYNVFRFDRDFYLQINGTAMGTRVAYLLYTYLSL